jgi:hypothetical protein
MGVVRVHCQNGVVYERDIDTSGRMFLGRTTHKSRTLCRKVRDEKDVRDIFRLITQSPVIKVEFEDYNEIENCC